jgi:gliding motility-associated-like protein
MVDFTGTATTPDGQTFASYLWNFGDANASTGNPNTATTINSQHSYLAGNYSVNFSATTVNGCEASANQNIVVNLKPAFSFPSLTAICENASSVSIALATVTNGVTGTGIYFGPGTTASGQFDPAAAGAGVHTIWFKLTSGAGCVDSVSQTIRVHPKPVADFSLGGTTNVCIGQNLSISPSSTISTGSITQWSWNLGNGTTPVYSNGSDFTTSYTVAGPVSITLVNTSDQGCVSGVITRTLDVRPLPVANFLTPTGICMPGGSTVFTNTSSIADNSTLSWQWNFGDGNTSTQQNPSHSYTTIGVYNVTLVATSPYGCAHQTMAVMNGFVAGPTASFRVSPQELCQGADNTFQDNSTPGGAAITSWSWDFADGVTSNLANPVKRFTQPGSYAVKLIVTNQAGCVSVPFTLPVTVHLQPVIDAGTSYVVQEGTVLTLNATANDPALIFSWTPPIGMSNSSLLNPQLTALQDQVYTLTAIGNFGCQATDTMSVKILKLVKVPNIFTPNGDQIHDRWVIPNLEDYPGATVQVFNRYGQLVFSSNGYGVAWDGTQQGKLLPVGTYYYIIQLKNGYKPLSGSVTLMR